MEVIQMVSTIVSLILSLGTLCVMIYGFGKFINKPHDSLEERVMALEIKQKETEQRLQKGNDKFREQDEANEVLLKSLIALLEFEIQYLLTENKPVSDDLKRAKADLNSFLAKK